MYLVILYIDLPDDLWLQFVLGFCKKQALSLQNMRSHNVSRMGIKKKSLKNDNKS